MNRAGEFVGIIFDGNIECLVWDYVFDDERGRAGGGARARDPRGAAQVYDADALVNELTGG